MALPDGADFSGHEPFGTVAVPDHDDLSRAQFGDAEPAERFHMDEDVAGLGR